MSGITDELEEHVYWPTSESIWVRVILGYEGKEYAYMQSYGPSWLEPGDDPLASIRKLYEDDDDSHEDCCDCSRSYNIQRFCGGDVSDLECGHTIKVLSLDLYVPVTNSSHTTFNERTIARLEALKRKLLKRGNAAEDDV